MGTDLDVAPKVTARSRPISDISDFMCASASGNMPARKGETHWAFCDSKLPSMVDFTNLPAFRSSEEVLAHPRFPFARDEFVTAVLALYEHNPSLNRLLLEASRNFLLSVIMCLH